MAENSEDAEKLSFHLWKPLLRIDISYQGIWPQSQILAINRTNKRPLKMDEKITKINISETFITQIPNQS